jgi:hypothetical protein
VWGVESALIHVVTEAPPAYFPTGEAVEEAREGVAVRQGSSSPDESVPRDRPRPSAFRDVRVLLEKREHSDE